MSNPMPGVLVALCARLRRPSVTSQDGRNAASVIEALWIDCQVLMSMNLDIERIATATLETLSEFSRVTADKH